MPTIPSILTPFVELQRDKEKRIDSRSCELRCQRVIDRALEECKLLMAQAVALDDPTSIDLADAKDGRKKLASLAAQLKIADALVNAEIAKVNDKFVKEKDAARARNADESKAEAVNAATRAITNAYAYCEAYATLIRDALAARKPAPKAAPPQPAAKPATKPAAIKSAVVKAPVESGKEPPSPGNDFELEIRDEPIDLGPNVANWLDEPAGPNDSVIGTVPPAVDAPPKKK